MSGQSTDRPPLACEATTIPPRPGAARRAPAAGAALPALDPEGTAVFFDVDGTLLDLAGTPEAVRLAPGLLASLAALERRLGGAMALVTGRAVDFIETLMPGLGVPVAGLHGAEWRMGGILRRPEPSAAFAAGRERLRRELPRIDGAVFEDKGAAFAAHFRLAPEREAEVAALMQAIAGEVGDGWTLQAGKAVIELRPAGRSKGDAVEAFLREPPFRGRRPLAFGDDLTDEAMFAAVNRAGGTSVRIGPDDRETLASHRLPSPAALRAWIQEVTA